MLYVCMHTVFKSIHNSVAARSDSYRFVRLLSHTEVCADTCNNEHTEQIPKLYAMHLLLELLLLLLLLLIADDQYAIHESCWVPKQLFLIIASLAVAVQYICRAQSCN
jgi:hypothetical protein